MHEKINVLLIEDNAVDAALVGGMLKHDEDGIFALKRVATLEEGMRSLSLGFGNQVILLDLGLPDASGLQTLWRIMPHAKHPSAVAITGRQGEGRGIAALR